MCSPLKREAHFWKPALSNRYSKFHFLEQWGLQMITHWAIFLALMALTLFSPLFRFSRPSEFWKILGKTCGFRTGSRPAKRHHYHTCNFVTFWWLVPFAVCFWWLHTHFFAKMLSQFAFFSYFYKNMLPARAGSTCLKPNSEQSAFKNTFFAALKGLDQDWMCHLFGTYRSFGRSVRLSSASIAHQKFNCCSWLVQF